MPTKRLSMEDIKEAASLIQQGECVAFQTETVYGLGADATQEEAVKKIYAAKGRPSDNPLIIHVASIDQALAHAQNVSSTALTLMENFWPGPLTLILEAKPGLLAPSVTAGLGTVGIRFPATEGAQALIKESKRPIAAPSANRSGKPSPTTADHVYHDLQGRIAGILDTGPAPLGLESTILDVHRPGLPVILRPGGLSRERIEDLIGPVSISHSLVSEHDIPMAPGMKYKHYAPDGDLFIVDGPLGHWQTIIQKSKDKGEKLAIIADDDVVNRLKNEVNLTYPLGSPGDSLTAASRLFDGLRYLDGQGASLILAQAYDLEGLGLAYMDRLEKAAGYRYL